MSDFKTRLIEEIKELGEKTEKLGNFIQTDKFIELNGPDGYLLEIQYGAMQTYLSVLQCRLFELGV